MERNMAKQQRGLASRRNLERLKLELSSIKQGVQSYELVQGNNGTWGFLRYGIGEEYEQTEADDNKVFNYTVEETVVDMKFPARGSKAECFSNVSAPNSIGIEVELQRAHQEETRMNFFSLNLGLDETEKKIQHDDD
ncbi:hypothetical protein DEO72_LG11g1392 [Vigna unguiculata]|uniref:Uncharacterized protein n=1 Tax=Vigna unguiculata TaxID=3917 RepID=A0A4D6NN03_VIGUN|nr:hypothetical protein DEO72_LG11g1392 [Vigna unguiculata]